MRDSCRDTDHLLCKQPRTATAEALHRAAAGQHQGKRVAARDAATTEERRDGTHGHALSRSDGKAQRMARRRRRPVGTRPLLDRRTATAGIHSGRRRAEEEGAAVDRMDVAEPARGRILRTGQGLRLRVRTATRQLSRLVAAHGNAEGDAAILFGHAGQARHRLHDKIFLLSVRHPAHKTVGQLDVLGGVQGVRQPAGRVLAIQHNGRRDTAQTGRADT